MAELQDLIIIIIKAKSPSSKKEDFQKKLAEWEKKFVTPEAIKSRSIDLWQPIFKLIAEEVDNPLNPLKENLKILRDIILKICTTQIKLKKEGDSERKIFEEFYVQMLEYHKAILKKKAEEIKEESVKGELAAQYAFLNYKLMPFYLGKNESKEIEANATLLAERDDLISLANLTRFKKDPAQLILLHAHIVLLTRNPILAKEKFKLTFKNIKYLHNKSKKLLVHWSEAGHNPDLKKFATLMLLTLNEPFIDKILQIGFRENIQLNILLRALFVNENYVAYLAQEENKANIQKQKAPMKILDKSDVAIKFDQIILRQYEEALGKIFGNAKMDAKEFARAKQLLVPVKMDKSSKVESEGKLQSDVASIKQLSRRSSFSKKTSQQTGDSSAPVVSAEKKKTPGS